MMLLSEILMTLSLDKYKAKKEAVSERTTLSYFIIIRGKVPLYNQKVLPIEVKDGSIRECENIPHPVFGDLSPVVGCPFPREWYGDHSHSVLVGLGPVDALRSYYLLCVAAA